MSDDYLSYLHRYERWLQAARERTLESERNLLLLLAKETQERFPVVSQVLDAVGKALGIDLAFLHEHPDALLTCLWFRCLRQQLATPEASSLLATTMQVWKSRAAELSKDGTWARPLASSNYSLTGALQAELRLDGLGALRSVDDDRVLFVDAATGKGSYWYWRKGLIEECNVALETLQNPWQVTNVWGEPARVRNVYEPSDGGVVLPYADYDAPRSSVVSRDGSVVLFTAPDEDTGGYLRCYSLQLKKELWSVAVDDPYGSLLLTRNDEVLLLAQNGKVYFYSVAQGTLLRMLEVGCSELAVSNNGRWLATRLGWAAVWNLSASGTGRAWDANNTTGPQFSPDGKVLLRASRLFDAETGEFRGNTRLRTGGWLEGGPPKNCFFLGNESAVSVNARLSFCDVRTGREVNTPTNRFFTSRMYVAYVESGTLLVFSEQGGGKVWAQRQGETEYLLHAEKSPIRRLAVSGDFRFLAVFTEDKEVLVYAINGSQTEVVWSMRFTEGKVTAFAFLPEEQGLVVASENGAVRVWSVLSGELRYERYLGEGDPSFWRNEREVVRYWDATNERLQELTWTLQEREPSVVSSTSKHGATSFVEASSGVVLGMVPEEGRWTRPVDPDARVFATTEFHARIERLDE